MTPMMWIILGGFVLLVLGILFFLWILSRSWNIDVVILKLIGDSKRPLIDLSRKAKVVASRGVQFLRIKKTPVEFAFKNFKRENYYQSVRGRPCLFLWEFQHNCFAPLTNELIQKIKLTTEETVVNEDGTMSVKLGNVPMIYPTRKLLWAERVRKQHACFNEEPYRNMSLMQRWFADIKVPAEYYSYTTTEFKFDPKMYKILQMRAVDDLDMEFVVRNASRVDDQYTTGWREWIAKHGYIFGWLIFGAVVIVALTLFWQKAPDLFAACASRAFEEGQKSFVEKAAATVAGSPGA